MTTKETKREILRRVRENARRVRPGIEALEFLREYLMEVGELQNGCVERALDDIEEALK